MTATVRRATAKDARAVAGFAIRLFAQHREYDARRFVEIASVTGAERFYGSQTEAADAAVLVAELEGEIVGFAYLQYEAMDYANLLKNAAWLHDIYVEERARAKGAGRLLIEKAAEIARQWNADKLMLSVAAKNELAHRFFERNGFRETMVEMMFDLTEKSDV